MNIIRENIVKEGYGAGFSFSSGSGFRGGMGSTSRGGFGGASNLGGPNLMYTYEIKPLNHTLEQVPSIYNNDESQIQIGSVVIGEPVLSNATPEKKKIKGVVHKIAITDGGAIKYYIVQDEATQNSVKLDPLSVRLIIHEPVEYYFDSTDANLSKRKEKIRIAAKERKIVRESIC
jgi:hypothetical protein